MTRYMDSRLYPSNEPLPPRDRRARLDKHICRARERIASLRISGIFYLEEIAALKAKIAKWQRELIELDK